METMIGDRRACSSVWAPCLLCSAAGISRTARSCFGSTARGQSAGTPRLAFGHPEIREAGNLPAFVPRPGRRHLGELPKLANGPPAGARRARRRLKDVLGGWTSTTLMPSRRHRRDRLLRAPRARRRGVATTIARMLAEHAFSLGVERVAAYVNVGNIASERVLDRVGFTRESVVRSMPQPDGPPRLQDALLAASQRVR